MARDHQSIVKMSRREGYALHPKAHKALLNGVHTRQGAQRRRNRGGKPSQYSLQLREKQKVKRLYGLLEKQFSNLMNEARPTSRSIWSSITVTIGTDGLIMQFIELVLPLADVQPAN